ncbi:MAG: thiamine phosphate synthase [Nitrospiraceae bacterium]|nr:thiamine phosphate synthase [Nitrospiraceae bacterium]
MGGPAKPDFRLYLITGGKSASSGELEDALAKALQGGVKAVQLREKQMPAGELLILARRLRELTERHHARLFINDRVDVAVAAGADGVHLGAAGLPPEAAQKAAGGFSPADKRAKDLMIGVSTHSLEDADQARRAGAGFITFGPVFDTPSKRAYGPPLGISKLRQAVRAVDIPVFAIGGIKPGNLKDVISAGAFGVALISGILGADDIEKQAGLFMRALEP